MKSLFNAFLRRYRLHKSPTFPPKLHITTLRAMSGTSAILYAATFTGPSISTDVPEKVSEKAHHATNGVGFRNPWPSWTELSSTQIFGQIVWRRLTGRLKFPDTSPPTVTVRKPELLTSRTGSKNLRATWLGHACYYVEFPNGLRVLFDPVFEERCSPFSFMGPKRFTEPPCFIADLPEVDVVIISHSHYDHLSHPTVLKIQEHFPNALFAVPLGLQDWFQKSGIKHSVELDWWQDINITLTPSASPEKRISVASSTPSTKSNPTPTPPPPPANPTDTITARISCLPCQHTSARTAFDKNHTLWASWAVTTPELPSLQISSKSVWFGGDTGYRAVPELPKDVDDWGEEFKDLPRCPAFKEIGELRGSFDLGLIPIGAYDPRVIMSPMHANPFDSVEIFKDTKCKRAMGIHWGTWALTLEEVLEPPKVLRQALKRQGLAETGLFDVCEIGESREF